MPVNWCEELGTVLANDEVVDGKSERGGYPVVRKNMRQWVIDIVKYADRLLEGLDEIDWPELQRKCSVTGLENQLEPMFSRPKAAGIRWRKALPLHLHVCGFVWFTQ